MSSAKWRPFCPVGDELNTIGRSPKSLDQEGNQWLERCVAAWNTGQVLLSYWCQYKIATILLSSFQHAFLTKKSLYFDSDRNDPFLCG